MEEERKKSEYRKYKIWSAANEVGRPDDFASMREVIYRRYMKSVTPVGSGRGLSLSVPEEKPKPLPDLIVVDGGKGQLSSAVKVLSDIGIANQNIIGLAKKLEEVFVPESSDPQSIPKTSSGLKLLQRIRDEAHRFAITFHRSLRDKRTLTSELESVPGIGKKTAGKLLSDFGSVEKIKEQVRSNFDEFAKKAGKKTAERLKEWLTGEERG